VPGIIFNLQNPLAYSIAIGFLVFLIKAIKK